MRRGDREADGARLLSECGVCHPGFESPPLRQFYYKEHQANMLFRKNADSSFFCNKKG